MDGIGRNQKCESNFRRHRQVRVNSPSVRL